MISFAHLKNLSQTLKELHISQLAIDCLNFYPV
jgi:hypothetical protein